MTHFWAKTTSDRKPGISVFDHMLNVGYVASYIAEISPELLVRFDMQSAEVGALAALHDLGKISPGFQKKCGGWLEENNLLDIARNGCWDTGMETDHGKVSHAAIQAFLIEEGFDRKTAKFLSAALGAHHGRLNPPIDRGYKPAKLISDTASKIDWDGERFAYARRIWDGFGECRTTLNLTDRSPSLWWLAGLTTVADWIGSNEDFFSPERHETSRDVSYLAQNALDVIGFRKTEFKRNLSFHDLFHDVEKPEIIWTPNEMQEKTLFTVSGPGVYVIEAPMGMGKTEAALWAGYKLLVSGKANGIYFALPTQATSNRVHRRVDTFLKRISPEAGMSRLIHGNSWLMDMNYPISPSATDQKTRATDDARIGRDWFASTKRAMLAPFGVGTVDQALLGIVAAKHFFVRHFALAGKVVILDEVHSYDMYTGTLIDKLITTLEGLGCTVIVLSATLTGKRLRQIISLPNNSMDSELPYPFITGRKEGEVLKPEAAAAPKSKTINVDFVTAEKATEEAIVLAQKGGAILWICNTVDAAQKQYQRFNSVTGIDFPVGLLHSRFPFWRREALESKWMEIFGKNSEKRCGAILVSTQVVEQSVDLDADLMITELAPTDMLLQRIGRLWRHKRENRPVDAARLCILREVTNLDELRNMESKEIIKVLGSKAYVYAPYVLLRSLDVWEKQSEVSIPSQIRPLIESTYRDLEDEPHSWRELHGEWFGTDSAKKMEAQRNCNLWQVALDDEEGVQTRLNEVPTVPLVLCRSICQHEVVFIDGTSEQLGGDKFLLPMAQAIHKNLVKVPEYCFEKDQIAPCAAFTDYLYGLQCVGVVRKDGMVEVAGLKNGIRFNYSDEPGLVIKKNQ
jgi:CRISPR-associated endonuclease/helicase Cas3